MYYDINKEKLRKTQQDKDIEGKKGTQPKKYYAKDADGDEMSKSTKDKRANQKEKPKKDFTIMIMHMNLHYG